MANQAKTALKGAMKDLRDEYPSLQGRLLRYRSQRVVYDAKRAASAADGAPISPVPAAQRAQTAHRELRV